METYPENYEEIHGPSGIGGLSNMDFTVDEGIENRLRNEPVWTRYAGWNFNGRVWFDKVKEEFFCQVWVYGVPVSVISKPEIYEMMHAVSSEYGYE